MRSPFIGGAGAENLDWNSIFASLGIDVPNNPRRHGPCPVCGGQNRFRFDNLDGSGSWYCNQGDSTHPSHKRAGDGFALVADVLDIGRAAAATKVLGGVVDRRILPVPDSRIRKSDPDRNATKIARILKNSYRIDDISGDNRIMVRNGQKAVETYLRSRNLPFLLPAETRILPEGSDYSLVIPLTGDGDLPPLHVTALTRTGQKRSLSWTGGSSRYAIGPLAGAYASIPGAEEQISVPDFPGVRFYAIAEGLETVLSGCYLSGWSSVFAINDKGVKTFLDNPETVKIFRSSGAGIAVLVDRDKSGAGQKASAALALKAKEAGIPALFLLPPSIIKGQKKGADWNDALTELEADGAKAALMLAISRSEEELSKIETGKFLPLDKIRAAAGPASPTVERVMVEVAAKQVKDRILDHREGDKPSLVAIDAGTGKSHILADLSWDHQIAGSPLLTITQTKALAEEAASKSGGLFREGRTDDTRRAGHCLVFPEIVPFSERWRSVVAHKCHDCIHGAAAMAVIRGETPVDDPCAHLLHVHDARTSPVVVSTAAMLEGDPHLASCKSGDAILPRQVALDDTSDLNDLRMIHVGHVAQWIRAAHYSIQDDQAKIGRGDGDDQGMERQGRIAATKALVTHLEALTHLLAANPGEEQIRINPEDWKDLSRLVKSSALKWVDGTSAEAIYRDAEGGLEIPLRTLKTLGEALSRGTAWVRKSILHFSAQTSAFRAIANGALVLDATPAMAVRAVIEACGGMVTEIRVAQPSLVITQVVSGSHGKTACSPDSPSFLREKSRALSIINNAVSEYGAENLAFLSHKSFVEVIEEEIPEGVEVGWWGRHNRGVNFWKTKNHLIIFGVPQLAPSVAEREYISDRQAVIEVGGTAWTEWNGARTERWYKIPGQAWEIHSQGYQDEFVDFWAREWTTSEVVQAIGRLRAVRRHDESLSVEIHSDFPFPDSFGFAIHEVRRADWRTMGDYQEKRKADQIEKGIIAFHATGGQGRRPANAWMLRHAMEGLSPNDWGEIKGMAGGIQREYSLFPSNTTTPDIFKKDVAILMESLDRLADYAAEEGMTLTELTEVGLVDPDPMEMVALEIFRTLVREGARREGPRGSWVRDRQKARPRWGRG